MKKSFKRKCIEFFARRQAKKTELTANHQTFYMFFHELWPATSASILAYHFSYHCAQDCYIGTFYDSPTSLKLFGILGAVIVWFIVLIIDVVACNYCHSILMKESNQRSECEQQKHKEAESERLRKIKFYEECQANGVSDITDTFDRKKAELIAQRLGYHYGDIEQYYREAEIAASQKR